MFGGMTTAAQLMVKVGADVSEAQSKLAGMSSTFKNLGGQAMALGGKMTLGITGPLVAAGAVVTRFASDLEESTNKVNVVFGEQATAMQAWAESAAQAFGMSKQQALEAAGTFGNLFTAMGVAGEQSADMSQSLIQLAADLASFNNIDPTEALVKLRAGLVGEAEPLRTLGVQLSAAAVEARALEMGLAGTKAELTEADKVSARYALIMEQTATAQGDFARTSEGLANQMRTVKAQFADAGAQLGTVLLPYVTKFVGWIGNLISYFTNLDPQMQRWIVAIGAAVAAIGPAITIVGALATALGVLLSPIGLVVAGVAALALAWQSNFMGIRDTVQPTIDALLAFGKYLSFVITEGDYLNDWLMHLPKPLQDITKTFGMFIASLGSLAEYLSFVITEGDYLNDWLMHLPEPLRAGVQVLGEFIVALMQVPAILIEQWGPVFSQIVSLVSSVFYQIGEIVRTVLEIVIGSIQQHAGVLQALFLNAYTKAKAIVQDALTAVASIVQSVLGAVKQFLDTHGADIQATLADAWLRIATIVNMALDVINATVIPIFQGIAQFLREHGEEIQTVLSAAWTIIKNVIDAALTLIQGILGAALAILKGDWEGAWTIIKDTLSSVWANIRAIVEAATTALVTAVGVTLTTIYNWFVEKFEAVKGYLQGIDLAAVGAAMIQGLIGGIQSMAGALVDAAKGVVNSAIAAAKALLGIRSPSRVFYGIGVDVITGLIQGIEDMTPEAVTTLSAALTAAMDGVLRVIEAASALGNMQVLADLPQRMRALNTMIREMVAELKVLAEFYANPGSGLDSAKAVMDALAPVFAGVKNAVEAFVAMGGIAAIEMLGAGLQTFIRFLQEVVPQLVRALAKAAEGLSDDALLAALAMSEVLTGISDALRKAMDMLTQFAVFDVPFDLFERGMWKLKETVVNLVEWLIAVASGLKTDGLPAAQAFSQAAQAVSQALSAAMDMLAKFATFEVPFNLFERGMWKLKETVVNLVQWLVTVASGLNLEGVPAARLFAEMAGLITTLLGEAMTVLERVQRYVAPAEDAILDFLRDVQFLMERALRWVQLVIVPLVEDVGVDLFDVLTGMVESLGEALALLEGLADYVAVGETAILAFMDDLDDLVRVFVRWVLGSRSGPILLLEVPTELMAIFEDAMAALETAVGVLTALVDYVSPGEAAILAFMADLDDLVRAFVYWVMSSRSGPILLLDVPAELMVIFSAVMDGLAAAVDVLTSLVDYVSPGEEAIAAFTADYQRLFVAFVAWAEGAFTDVALETVQAVADAVGAVFSGLGDAVGVLSGIVDYVGPSDAAIAAFETDYQRLFSNFATWAVTTLTDVAVELVQAVGDAVGSVFSGLGDAAGVLASIVDYVGPSSAAINGFETDYQRLFSNFAMWAEGAFTDVAVDLVEAVGNAVGSVFDGLGAAAATLQSITWYVGPTSNSIDRFMADMEQVMIRLRDWATDNLTTESTAFLLAFGQMAGTLFSAVGSALSLMEGIADYTVSGSTFDLALQRFNDNLYTMLQSWRIWIVTVMDPETLALVAAFAGVMGAIVTGFRDALNLLMDIENANLPTADQLQAFLDAVTLLFNHVIDNFGNVATQIATLSGQMGSALATTLLIMSDHIALFAQQAAIEIDTLFSGMGVQMWVQGRFVAEMFMNGLLAGMTNVNAQNLLLDAMNALALALKDVLMAAWGIASPSKVAEGIGKNFVAGLANGLADLQGIPAMIEDAVGLTMNNNVRLTPAPQRAYLTVNFQGAYQSGMSQEEEARISRVMVMELRRQGVALVTR